MTRAHSWRSPRPRFAAALLLLAHMAVPARADEDTGRQYFDMNLSQLMEITITSAAKKPQTLADTAAAVFVITQEDIRRSGVTSIPEALAMAPGIQVARISASKWSISSRGFAGYTSNKLLVLIDGRSVYSPAYSGVFWNMQNTLLEDVDRIEVIRGPGGTVWGANAVNGVINIITRKASETQGSLVRAGVGSEERFMGAGRHGGRVGDNAFARLYVSGNDRGSNTLAGGDEDAFDGWNTIQGGFRTDGRVGSNSEWTVQGDVFKNDGDQILFPFWVEQSPYLVANRAGIDNSGANLLGHWQHQLGGGRRLSAQAYWDYSATDEEVFNVTYHTLDTELQYETPLGRSQALSVGLGFRRVDGSSRDSYQLELPERTDDLYSIFLQDAISMIEERLVLTLGTKYEHNDYTGCEWQPSAKLLWKPAERHSLWTSMARAVHTPSANEHEGRVLLSAYPPPDGLGPVRLAGSTDFDSETVIAYEAGYRWQQSQRLSVDLALFYNEYDSIYTVSPRARPDGLDMAFINNGVGEGYGMEASVDWKAASWLRYVLSYAYLDISFEWEDPTLALDSFKSFIGGLTPRHQVGLRQAIDLSASWQLNAWLRYVDPIECRNTLELLQVPRPVDSYLLLDLNLIWKPSRDLEVMLAGQNLLNGSQLEYVAEFLTPPTEIERGVYAKLTWRF